MVKNLSNSLEMGLIPGEDPLEEEMEPIPVFLPGTSPWTEEPGGLQYMGHKKIGHGLVTK